MCTNSQRDDQAEWASVNTGMADMPKVEPNICINVARLSLSPIIRLCVAVPIQPYVAVVYRFNGLHRCNPCKYKDYYSFTNSG